MINVLEMTDEEVVDAYVRGIAAILSTSHVRWTRSNSRGDLFVRIWNGTRGLTARVWMDRKKLEEFTVESVAESIGLAISQRLRAFYVLDHGATGNYENALGGRDHSWWGDYTGPWQVDTLIREKIKEAVYGKLEGTKAMNAAIRALPEMRRLAAEARERCLAQAEVARKNYCKAKYGEMCVPLEDLLGEGLSKEEILAAVGRMIDVLQGNRGVALDTPAAVTKAMEEHVQARKNQAEKDLDRLMDRLRKETTEGTFRPEEWAWCFTPDTDGTMAVGQLADGERARFRFRPEDIAFIRANCSPREVDEVKLGTLVNDDV